MLSIEMHLDNLAPQIERIFKERREQLRKLASRSSRVVVVVAAGVVIVVLLHEFTRANAFLNSFEPIAKSAKSANNVLAL